jgi:hypothetical protein
MQTQKLELEVMPTWRKFRRRHAKPSRNGPNGFGKPLGPIVCYGVLRSPSWESPLPLGNSKNTTNIKWPGKSRSWPR